MVFSSIFQCGALAPTSPDAICLHHEAFGIGEANLAPWHAAAENDYDRESDDYKSKDRHANHDSKRNDNTSIITI